MYLNIHSWEAQNGAQVHPVSTDHPWDSWSFVGGHLWKIQLIRHDIRAHIFQWTLDQRWWWLSDPGRSVWFVSGESAVQVYQPKACIGPVYSTLAYALSQHLDRAELKWEEMVLMWHQQARSLVV